MTSPPELTSSSDSGGFSGLGGSGFAAAVERIVAGLAPGECASYGEVADEAGRPGAARAVGNLMRGASHLPWWRVIRSDGSLAMGADQALRLQAEGVAIVNGRVRPAGR